MPKTEFNFPLDGSPWFGLDGADPASVITANDFKVVFSLVNGSWKSFDPSSSFNGLATLRKYSPVIAKASDSASFPIELAEESISGVLLGNTYYVANVPGAGGNGLSPANAFSVSEFEAFLTNTGLKETNSQPDTVLFRGGDTLQLAGKIGIHSGTSADTGTKPYIFGSYGNGRAKLVFGNNLGFDVYNRSARVENLDIISGSTNFHGIQIYSNLTNADITAKVLNCSVKGFDRPVSIGSGSSSTVNIDAEVIGVRCSAHKRDILIYSSNDAHRGHKAIVRNCHVEPQEGNGIVVGNATGVLIDNCTFSGHNSSLVTSQADNAFWLYRCNDGIISNCTVTGARGNLSDTDCGAYDIDITCTNCAIINNIAVDCYGYGALIIGGSGHKVIGNIFINCCTQDVTGSDAYIKVYGSDSSAGIVPVLDCEVAFNTIIMPASTIPGAAGIEVGNSANTGDIRNNVIYTVANHVVLRVVGNNTSNMRINDNLYFSSSGNPVFNRNGSSLNGLANFRAGNHERRNAANTGIQADPLFIGANASFKSIWQYRPLAGSPLLDAVTVAGNNEPFDLYGNAYSSNIGAYQGA
ncbi:right-handed parallel beta-helix repeat-containing protein [Sphaerothrix gracilis]|uniref:right-handed parallel beta-helix repeat-containing protein n=1 Tax=Sphaerothrix gracilis TaxID=3151835 RepID=UPI0031FBC3E9